jgi:hypothetical protein
MLRMYTLCLVGVLGVALAACGGGTRRTGSGNFQFSWQIGWQGGGLTSCASAGVASIDLDVQDTYSSQVVHDSFNCTANQGSSRLLPVSDYTVAVRARDSAGNLLSEAVLPNVYSIYLNRVTDLGVVRMDVTGAPVATSGGSFSVSWRLAWNTGASASCASAGATEVDLDVLDIRTNTAYHDTFNCSDSQGTTDLLPASDYSVALRVYDTTVVPPFQLGETVLPSTYSIYDNAVTPLPLVVVKL